MLEWIAHHPAAAIFGMFVGFAVLEFLRGRFRSAQASSEDAPLEVSITLLFAALIYPGIVLVVGFLATHYTPGLAGSLAGLPTWAMIALLLVGDDLTQYAWHRASHSPLLWPLHRAHHSAPHMGIRVVYRNNF
ncbi:MAG: sterol desaturase family protein, partial [Xanthomonadales bacterium]|nr:sterol desaturase family protein [Xanthomonadales bacterium]